jgi:hypothetical protein
MQLDIHEETGHVSIVWRATVVCIFALVSQGKLYLFNLLQNSTWTLSYRSNRIYCDYASIYIKQLIIPIMH